MQRLLSSLLATAFALSLGTGSALATDKSVKVSNAKTMASLKKCINKGETWVKGYTKKDGTKVKGYCKKS